LDQLLYISQNIGICYRHCFEISSIKVVDQISSLLSNIS